MSPLSRRAFFLTACVGTQALLTGCGGGGGGSADAAPAPSSATSQNAASSPAPAPAAQASAPAPAWQLGQTLSLMVGGSAVIDLKTTLPSGVAAGGRFEVDASGSALPGGVVLSPDGVLSVGATAGASSVAGVVFAYIEP